jgi:hypothetical protein
MRKLFCVVAALAVVLAVSGIAAFADEVLFSDDFTPAHFNQPDINEGYAARQTGIVGAHPWLEKPATASGGSFDGGTYIWHPWNDRDLMLNATSQSFTGGEGTYLWASPDYNFDQWTHKIVEVDVWPHNYPYGGPRTDWAALTIGTDVPGTYAIPGMGDYGTPNSRGAAITLTSLEENGVYTGRYAIYESYVWGASTPTVARKIDTLPGHNDNTPYHLKVEYSTAAFDGVAPHWVHVAFSIDNTMVYEWDCDPWINDYITLSGIGLSGGAYSTHVFDNFKVTAVPEPSALAGLIAGMFGMASFAIRRRK